ncbi:hypothetical protein OE88DRAFT_1600820, partial [Heliocybe sulcata]
FRIHYHQHPAIPFDDVEGTHLTADEIHEGAVSDMYHYCLCHDLSQVWAYLWNCWYSPAQWVLWARSAEEAIPVLKTTMIVESFWRVIKHRDLRHFNRPRLDLSMHVVLTKTVPWLRQKLAILSGEWRKGRGEALAEWQKDLRELWLKLSDPDELMRMKKELKILYLPQKTKGRAERLAQVRAE